MKRSSRSQFLVALLLVVPVASCVGRVVPVPIAVDHPANPDAAVPPFVPMRPEYSLDSPPPDGAAPSHGGHEHHAEAAAPPPATGHEHHAGATVSPPATAPGHGDQARVDEAVRAYVAVARALAADDFVSASEHATHLRAASKELVLASDARLRDAGSSLSTSAETETKDIAALRESFRRWSPVMIELAHRNPPSRAVAPALSEVHCPMADASWLQEGTTVANPYFGAKMPHCGSIVSTIESREEPAK